LLVPAAGLLASPSLNGGDGEEGEVDMMAAVRLALRQVGAESCFVAVAGDAAVAGPGR
jgi:hypothetical protein